MTAAAAEARRVHWRLPRPEPTGPVLRLVSPSGVGGSLKPFVFLDLFEVRPDAIADYPLHPHSGIATVTVIAEGGFEFSGPAAGSGRLGYGGVEWMRAGRGVWHGDELRGVGKELTRGFQLWVALPPDLELAPPDAQYLEASSLPSAGPARVILGSHGGVKSPVRAPADINYLLVTLEPGQTWTYAPPAGHSIVWTAVATGTLGAGTGADDALSPGELAIYEGGDEPVVLTARGREKAVFVLGSAVPHPHDLVLGQHSVHTSAEALRAAKARLAELRPAPGRPRA